MRYNALPALESMFLQNGNAGEYDLRKFQIPVPGEQLQLNGFLCTPKNRSGYYYATEYPKQRIVIHYTAGQLRSDMSALTRNDYHVSVPFVIARDGTIYQLFSSKFWSGHLGKGLGNTNTGNAEDKCTIGIELSNYGYLTKVSDNLETYYSRRKNDAGLTGPVDVYCSLSEMEAYEKSTNPFRGESYYATYTRDQYESLIVLLRYLTAQYGIPRAFLPESDRFRTTDDVLRFKGIVTHINYRVDGKWDIGPAFDWKKVIDGVNSPVFQKSASRSATEIHGVAGLQQILHAESEAENYLPAPKDKAFEDQPYEDEMLSTGKSQEVKRKLYALLVGIDDYEEQVVLTGGIMFPALSGCVKDANKIKAYLSQDPSFEPHIRVLENKKATKKEIVKAFREHLGKAQQDDVVVFYYSGHGTQERSDTEVWTADTDGKLECIACYYDKSAKDDFLLSDKELRYLIHDIAARDPHIVTIFDCCHSADNTRNGAFATTIFPKTVEKRIPFVFAQREWNKFIFHDKISRDKVLREGEIVALPEAHHVQLSACESDESAVEQGGEGVFTRTLLKVLQSSGGDVTYQSLQNRVRQYLRNIYEQKPRIYIPQGDPSILYSIFLNKPFEQSKGIVGEVTYNLEAGWQLNLGAIHGIGKGSGELVVINPENLQEQFKATVTQINTDFTRLSIPGKLDTSRVYHGFVEGIMSATLKVNVQQGDGLPEDQQALMDQLLKMSKDKINLEDEESKGRYIVRCSNGKYYLTYPGDPYRPLIKPVDIGNAGAPGLMAGYLHHISRWEFLNNIQNGDSKSKLSHEVFLIELGVSTSDGNFMPVDCRNGEANIHFESMNDQWRRNIRIRITNTSSVNLYCAALYLTSSFGSFTGMLNPPVYLLEAGNSVLLKIGNNDVIPVKLGEVTKFYNWSEQIEFLKFIFSTELFDAHLLSLEELPRPAIPADTEKRGTKGIDLSGNSPADIWGWTTKSITLRFQNPEYNMIREADLNSMLSDPDTADFALGLYFDASINEQLQPVYTIKPSIRIIADASLVRQKGFIQDRILDLANYWARNRRNKQYNELIKRFPDRLRIVSEGDSWFQHPLVIDVIDHLARVYPIYCVAAAGDTLRNYLSREKKNGEYFLDAIDEKKPAFFLISGGGNDILGSQFRLYLKDNPDNSLPEGEQPQRFLKDAIFEDLKELMEIYRTLFGNLRTHHPLVHVIVHGYDYPAKLNQANKGWLGRYMIEKGISRAGDRSAIIHLIMDTFNESLKMLAAAFDNVSYIDVRNLIRYNPAQQVDQWYDEIHPNNEGFQQVAMKFMQKIDEITRRVSVTIIREGESGPLSVHAPGITGDRKQADKEVQTQGDVPSPNF